MQSAENQRYIRFFYSYISIINRKNTIINYMKCSKLSVLIRVTGVLENVYQKVQSDLLLV